MADNTELNVGAGGDVISTDDIAGVKVQRVKVQYGVDGAATDVSDTDPMPIDDAGGSLTVDNAALSVVGGGAEATALRVTVASDSTGVLSVDDNGASLTVDNAGLTTIAGAVSGTEMQVDVVAALPAGTNNIGDVDVLSVVPGTGATSLGKAIDSAGGGTDTGVAVLAIRDDSLTTLTPVDGDYVPLRVSSTGALHVTGSAGMTQYTEDGASAGGESLALAGAVRQDTLAASTSTDGDYGYLKTSSTGALYVNVAEGGIAGRAEDSAHSSAQDGIPVLAVRRDSASSGVDTDGDYAMLSVTSDGSLRVSGGGGGTEYTVDAAAPAAPTGATFVMERDDALSSLTEIEGDWTNPRASANGAMWVAVDGTVTVGSHAVTNAGTFAVQAAQSGTWTVDLGATDNAVLDAIAASLALLDNSISAGNELQVDVVAALPAGTNNIGDVDILSIAAGDNNIGNVDIVTMPNVTLAAGTNTNEVVGDAADDAATAGNPVLVGGVAVETDGTDPTTVSAEGDAAYLRTDRARRLLVSTVHPRLFRASADYASAQTNATVQAAPGANLSLYITDVIISNGATAGNVTLLDGSGGTVLLEIYPPINGGVAHSFHTPLRLTANTLLAITSTTVTTHAVNISGYIAP